MNRFGKHLAVCFGWLLLSEILCLILGVSIAILRNPVIVRGAGILFGAAAHILLIGNAAQKTADEDAAFYRTSGTAHPARGQRPSSRCSSRSARCCPPA